MLKIGVMGCANIAKRAMIPAMLACADVKLVAVASRTQDKANDFARQFGCEGIAGYDRLLERDDIDAIYMPLPTGLHTEWVTKALEANKHLLVEKSFSDDFASAESMIELARNKKLVVLENYLFPHHSQHQWVLDFIAEGNLGDVHLVRSTFGFPPLAPGNFRYDKSLGGGALLDAGGYVLKAAQAFLGADITVAGATLQHDKKLDVDIYGEAMLRDRDGKVAQLAFGFDYFYQCNYELLGTKGKLIVERAFTPPPGFRPLVHFEKQDSIQTFTLPADNHYRNMFSHFNEVVAHPESYERYRMEILLQARLLETIQKEGTQ